MGKFSVNDAPRLAAFEVIEKLRETVAIDEYLFYRTGADENDWVFGGLGAVWECQCTACGQTFLEEKDRKKPPKGWKSCPRCGAAIVPRRWKDRAVLDGQELSFQVFQRGDPFTACGGPPGEASTPVWLRGYQVSRGREGEFYAWEYARAVFYPGGARRWTRARNYFDGELPWKERKSVNLKCWHSGYGNTRENWFTRIDREEVTGTVMEYSQYDQALAILRDPVEYLALYCKYPACEYLWKAGLGWMFKGREFNRAGFQKCVNLRAKTPKGLLRGLSKADIKAARGMSRFESLEAYRRLREAGAILPDSDGVEYANAVAGACERVRERCFDYAKAMHKYFVRQKKRSGLSMLDLLRDYGDYLQEIDEIGGAELMPDDLREAHERLSARLRKKRTARSNPAFRIRRRLLSRYRFAWHGMLIRPIDSESELIREGELQHNCVAGYAGRHTEGATAIFVLRRRDKPQEPWCTVEYREKENEVRQCRAYRNGEAPPEAWEFIERWLSWIAAKEVPRERGA